MSSNLIYIAFVKITANIIKHISKQIAMNIEDFKGLTKFKVIIPLVYVLSWIAMFMGPIFFPVGYQQFTIGCLIFTIIKIATVFIGMIIVTIKSQSVFRKARENQQTQEYRDLQEINEQINYAFIIPNYKQELEILQETLDVLAAHKRAKSNYLIFLAMEAHEPGSEQKAAKLIRAYRDKFRYVNYTRHQIRQYEQKGKASNVSWCAENLQPFFEQCMIHPDSVMITILDADSWAPDVYYDILEQKIYKEYQNRFRRIYMPTQIFTRNNLDVPMFTRIYDILHSFAHASNLFSCFQLTYPLSNYTLSYRLIKDIGFWDTCADAIGQDFHTAQKAYWKTNGTVKMRPIYACFNQVNIETGNGYWADLKARFWQAERHAKGVADVAYSMKMLLNQPFRLKNIVLFYHVLEAFIITALVPWVTISLNYQQYILYRFYMKPNPQLFSSQAIGNFFTVMTILGTTAYLFYELFKRRSNRIIYQRQNESILRLLEYALFFVIIFLTMSVPAFVIAAFKTLFGQQEYVVAEKKGTGKGHADHH